MRSIASVVYSVNRSSTKFFAHVTALGAHQEEIVTLQDSMRAGLTAFHRTTGLKPERILYLRDGVSEGQFNMVLTNEVAAMRRACQGMGDPAAEYMPPVTAVIVQKRHNTRIFGKDAAGGVVNLCPGVIVDRDIVDATKFGASKGLSP